ncbi:hypothetical protein MUO83_08865 [Candidatus Bathyarchaeota archaeon]|nr:hypothetical protein [Candidatus Bathyarchaeota archaeon]
MESKTRDERDAFRSRLKEEWGLLWTERFDDRVRAEGVSVRDYPLLFMSRGHVIFATRDAKAPSFSQIMEVWASQGLVYSPDPDVGGWGKFVRAELNGAAHSRARTYVNGQSKCEKERQQLKKGGRGWLHY